MQALAGVDVKAKLRLMCGRGGARLGVGVLVAVVMFRVLVPFALVEYPPGCWRCSRRRRSWSVDLGDLMVGIVVVGWRPRVGGSGVEVSGVSYDAHACLRIMMLHRTEGKWSTTIPTEMSEVLRSVGKKFRTDEAAENMRTRWMGGTRSCCTEADRNARSRWKL